MARGRQPLEGQREASVTSASARHTADLFPAATDGSRGLRRRPRPASQPGRDRLVGCAQATCALPPQHARCELYAPERYGEARHSAFAILAGSSTVGSRRTLGEWPEGQRCSAPVWLKRVGSGRDPPTRCGPVVFRALGEPLGERAALRGIGAIPKGVGSFIYRGTNEAIGTSRRACDRGQAIRRPA